MTARLESVLEMYGLSPAVRPSLLAALRAREDEIADQLRLAGVHLGAMPEFVAEVLAEVGLGTPPDDATRALIRAQFVDCVNRINEEIRRARGDNN